MGISGIGFGELLLVLAILVLVFGTSKLKDVGGDLGAALKNFRQAMRDGEEPADKPALTPGTPPPQAQGQPAAPGGDPAEGSDGRAGRSPAPGA